MKTSFIFSQADRVLQTTSSSTQLSTKYDDNYTLNGQTIIPDPEVTWIVPANVSLSTNNQAELIRSIWPIINGDNYHGITRYYLSNKGLFYNEDMKNKGIFPINFKMIGEDTNWTVTKLTAQPFNVGMYTQSPTDDEYSLSDPMYTQYRSVDEVLSEIEWPTDEEIVSKINSISYSPNSYNLFASILYDVGSNQKRIFVSLTPLLFSQDKTSFTTDEKYSLTPITKSNVNTNPTFHVVLTSKVWVFDENWKMSKNYHKSSLNITDAHTNDVQLRRGNYIPLSGYGYDKDIFVPSSGQGSWRYQEVEIMDKIVVYPFILNVTKSEFHQYYSSKVQNDRNGTWIWFDDFTKFKKVFSELIKFSSWKDKDITRCMISIPYTDGSSPPSTYSLNPFVKSKILETGEWKSQIPVDYNAPLLRFGDTTEFDTAHLIDSFSWDQISINVKISPSSETLFLKNLVKTMDQKISLPFINKRDSYHKYKIDRMYDPDNKPLFKTIPVSSSHFSQVRSVTDDIVLSNDLDNISGLGEINTDFFFSNIIFDSDQKKSEYQAYLDKVSTINPLDKMEEAIQNDKDLSSKDKYLVKEVLRNNYDTRTVLVDTQGPQVDYSNYQSFKRTFMSFMTEETKTGIIGHNRILSTNPNESPLYDSLISMGLDDEKIKQFSLNLKDEFDSITGSDTYAMIDSIDLVNEISIINSLISSQVNELNNAVEKISNLIQGSDVTDTDSNQNLMDSMSSIFSAAGSLSQTISQSLTDYVSVVESTIAQAPGAYDSLMLKRAVDNATGYISSFVTALVDDPYLALKQHSNYLRNRADKISIKASVIDKILSGMDVITKIPSLFISGITSMSKIIGTIAKIAVSGAIQAITIIDNIDKLVFISEQFLSRGVEKYSSIPTVYDDMFTPPQGFESKYSSIRRKAMVEIRKDLSTSSLIKDILNQTKSDPIIIDGESYIYNDYDVDSIVGSSSGFYYPKASNLNLPLIRPNTRNSTFILPDLSEFIPVYPQRGSLWLTFLRQLDDNKQLDLSPYIPLTPELVAFYSGMIVTAALAAGAAAAVAAGVRADIWGAAFGAIAAISAVTAANASELVNIIGKRHMISDNKDVYTHFSNNYNNYKTKWESKVTQQFITDNYVFVMTDENVPLYSDASDFKKFFIQIKEILFLIGNLTMLVTASVIIGKVTKKVRNWMYVRGQRKHLANVHKFENQAYKDQKDKAVADINSKIADINNDQSLSQSEKDKQIAKLNDDKANLIGYYDSKVKLNPTNKGRLNGILSANWGVGIDATSPVAGQILNMSSIGPATSQALKGFSTQVEKFIKGNEELESSLDNINKDSLSPSDIISSATSNLLTLLIKVKDDTDTLKKFV